MKKKEFIAAVEHEIKALKELAKPSELNQLNFNSFSYDSPESCIYGQLTGSCTSKRAKELMDQACIIVTNGEKMLGVHDLEQKSFLSIRKYINGENTGQGWNDEGGSTFKSRSYSYLSALEAYIALKGAKNENIIKFLRGEISELKL